MKIEKVEGIVVSETNYSESSKILNIYTKEHGTIGVIAKGSRSLKSKLRSVSTKLTYGFFQMYYKEDSLSTLISVDVINSLKNIKSDIKKISYASYIIDLVVQVNKQCEEDIFDLFRASLLKLEEGLDPLVITNILEIKLLEVLGVMPSIDCCSVCGSQSDIVTISVDQGGYLCKNCVTTEDKIYDEKVIKLLRMYYYVDIEKITKLEVKENIEKEINEFLDLYYDKYTGLYLKSKNFLKKLNHLETLSSTKQS